MGRTYFGLALSSSMFEGDLIITRRVLSPEEVRRVVADGVDSYLSSTHKSIIRVLESRFGDFCRHSQNISSNPIEEGR